MLIRNVRSFHDLEQQKKLQAEILQIQIDNESILNQRVSDFKNPNKAPPVPPQYKTVSEIQKDLMEQQKQVIQNLRDYGMDFNEAVKVVNVLPQLLGGTQNLYKFNQFFPAIKEKILKNLNPKDLDAQTLKERLRVFFNDIDASIGLNFEGIRSTNVFNGDFNESQLILGSREQYIGLFRTFKQIVDNFMPDERQAPPELIQIVQTIGPQIAIMISPEAGEEDPDYGVIKGIAPTFNQLSAVSGLSYVERRAYLQALNNFVNSDGFPSYKYLSNLNDKVDESGIFRLNLIRKYEGDAVEGYEDTDREYSQKLSYTNTQLIAEMNDLSQKLGYALTPAKIERLRNFKEKLRQIDRDMREGAIPDERDQRRGNGGAGGGGGGEGGGGGGGGGPPPPQRDNGNPYLRNIPPRLAPRRSERGRARVERMLRRGDERLEEKRPDNISSLFFRSVNDIAPTSGVGNAVYVPNQDTRAKSILKANTNSKIEAIEKRNRGMESSEEYEEMIFQSQPPKPIKLITLDDLKSGAFNTKHLFEYYNIKGKFSSRDAKLQAVADAMNKEAQEDAGQPRSRSDSESSELERKYGSPESSPILTKKSGVAGIASNYRVPYTKESLKLLQGDEIEGLIRRYRMDERAFSSLDAQLEALADAINIDRGLSQPVPAYAKEERGLSQSVPEFPNPYELQKLLSSKNSYERNIALLSGRKKQTQAERDAIIERKSSRGVEGSRDITRYDPHNPSRVVSEQIEKERKASRSGEKESRLRENISYSRRIEKAPLARQILKLRYEKNGEPDRVPDDKLVKSMAKKKKDELIKEYLKLANEKVEREYGGNGVKAQLTHNGKKHSFIKSRIKIGKGITNHEEEPKFRLFGKFMIHMPQLHKENILNLKYQSNGPIPSIKPVRVDENYKEFVLDVIHSGRVNDRHFKSLTEPEQIHFVKITRGAGIIEHLKLKTQNHDKEAEELKRLELLIGEVEAGNDNDKMIKEAKTLIKKFVSNGRINKNKGMDMLMTLEK
jgi:hypothetical protein